MRRKKLLTQGQFAKLVGVRQPSISEQVRKGRLRANKKGLIDPEDPLSRTYIERHPYQRQRPGRKTRPARKKARSVQTSAKKISSKAPKLRRIVHVDGETFTEAERREKIASAGL